MKKVLALWRSWSFFVALVHFYSFTLAVQRALIAPARRFISLGSMQVALDVVHSPKARRYLLRMKPDGAAQLTVPRGGKLREAEAFLGRNLTWLERAAQRAASRPRVPGEWRLGTSILWRGEEMIIQRAAESGAGWVQFGAERTLAADASGDLRPVIERHILMLARAELPPEVFALAVRHGVSVRRVTVRNQRSRWGSCSRRGVISLNWRILQAPPSVREYLIIHELMHLREMNHSPRFWAHVAEACPAYREAECWLNAHGYLLR